MFLWRNKKDISIFRMKKSAVSVAMSEALQMNIYTICFYGEISKIVLELPLNTSLIAPLIMLLFTHFLLFSVYSTFGTDMPGGNSGDPS